MFCCFIFYVISELGKWGECEKLCWCADFSLPLRNRVAWEMGISMTNRTKSIIELLDKYYTTEYRCSLDYRTPWELLVATMLSAQCTDERVNRVTKDLFVKYSDVKSFAEADLKEMERDIHSVGFYHSKAVNVINTAKMIIEKYNGEVPRGLEELTQLPGVGRKTANVIRGNIFHDPSIVVDTHVKRISYRLGFTKETDPYKIELDLMKKLPKDHWIVYNIQIITFGREICTARAPKCSECFLKDLCRSKDKTITIKQ